MDGSNKRYNQLGMRNFCGNFNQRIKKKRKKEKFISKNPLLLLDDISITRSSSKLMHVLKYSW